MPETVADAKEFGLIKRLQALIEREGVVSEGITTAIGDDTAGFRPRQGYEILVTCDCMVENRHYLSGRIRAEDLGRRAMTSNISDVGAMGGQPLYALVSLGLRPTTLVADVEDMYRGFMRELNPFGASLIGGNVTQSAHGTFIDITLIGEVREGKRVLRSTAKPGDVVLVTGYPGQALAGLQLLLRQDPLHDLAGHPLVRAYTVPSHRALEGQAIADAGFASAMIDTSDGFLGDLGHICEQSGVGATLYYDRLPVSEALRKAADGLGRPPQDLVLGNSDDYELIITCASHHVEQIRLHVAAVSDVIVSEVGRITESEGGIKLLSPDGTEQHIAADGWDHFSRLGDDHV